MSTMTLPAGARPFADFTTLDADTIRRRTLAAKKKLGKRVVLLGHHYQRDSIVEFADFRGDSFKLSQLAAEQQDAEFIVFCGVHFMAESADVLRQEHQSVILPDLKAGCSMADMAARIDVDDAWDQLVAAHGETITPVTYMNSTAALKAFCGARGGVVCTSGNAARVLEWAWGRRERVFFFPDQHLGRNTAFAMGTPLEQMAEWNWRSPEPHVVNRRALDPHTRIILWQGFCSVHTKFTKAQIDEIRAADPAVKVMVHPECAFEVVQAADLVGSTEFIIERVRAAAPGTHWAIGTEIHLVHRLAQENPAQLIGSLQKNVCPCATMNRIDPAHLLWALENLADGVPVNVVRVADDVRRDARIALDRMLTLKGDGAVRGGGSAADLARD
jgi:quinolinate synthase